MSTHGDPLGTNPTPDDDRDPATVPGDPATVPGDPATDDTVSDVLPEGTEAPEGPTAGLP